MSLLQKHIFKADKHCRKCFISPFLDSQASHLAFPFKSRSPGLSAVVIRHTESGMMGMMRHKKALWFFPHLVTAYRCWRLQLLPVCIGHTDPAAPGLSALSSLSWHPLQSSRIPPADRWEAVSSEHLWSSETMMCHRSNPFDWSKLLVFIYLQFIIYRYALWFVLVELSPVFCRILINQPSVLTDFMLFTKSVNSVYVLAIQMCILIS